MIDKFLAFSKENSLIKKKDKILVGVSGGVDSTVLLDILLRARASLGIEIAVVHVNYGLRKESDRDEEFVRLLAKKNDLALYSKRVKLSGGNIEEKARDERYRFFNQVLESEKFDKIAVAHQKNDLAETFFLNSARGSGLRGLVSMRPKTGNLIRPLLFLKRKKVENYAKKHGLQFVEDSTNKDLAYKRNLVRHSVIPELEKINPGLIDSLANEIETLRDAEEVISQVIEKKYKSIAVEQGGQVEISVKDLEKLDDYEKSEILMRAILGVKKDLKDISRKNIGDLLELIEKTNGTKKIHLPSSLIAERTYGKLEIRKDKEKLEIKPKKAVLKIGKEVNFGGWKLFLSKDQKKIANKSKNLVFLDIKKTPKLLVRLRKPGDRMDIGGGKTKKIQDIFVDEKVPAEERGRYPIVVNQKNDSIVWLPGIRVSPSYTPDNQEGILLLKITGNKIEKK